MRIYNQAFRVKTRVVEKKYKRFIDKMYEGATRSRLTWCLSQSEIPNGRGAPLRHRRSPQSPIPSVRSLRRSPGGPSDYPPRLPLSEQDHLLQLTKSSRS